MKTIKFHIIAIAITAITFLSSAQTDHNNTVTDKVNRTFVNYLFNETMASAETIVTNGSDGSILKSTDNGLTWFHEVLTLNNDFFSSVNDFDQYDIYSNGVAVGNSGRYYVTTDCGVSFETHVLDVEKNISKVAVLSSGNYLLCGENGLCKFSPDGITWDNVYFGGTTPEDAFVDIAKVGNDAAFVLSTTGLYLIQGSSSIQNSSFEFSAKPLAIDMSDLSNGFLVGTDKLLAVTSDGGNKWQEITSPILPPPFSNGVDLKDVEIRADGLVFAVGTKGTIVIYNPSDNSLLYKQIEIESQDGDIEFESRDLTSIEFKDEMHGMITGKEGAAYITNDGGATWIAVTFDDGGDRPSNPIKNTEAIKDNTSREKTTMSQNFPNPFNPSTRIGFTLPSDSKVSIKVYDLTGREVRTLVNDFRSAGSYSVEFNAGNLSSGVYFYTLVANGITDTKRMILTK